jgi:hypothetical protein
MDIRLIFRNRRRTAHDEPCDAKRLKPSRNPSALVWVGVVVERATRTRSSQAME